MSPKPRNRAGMDAEAVARMMAAQEQAESEPHQQTPAPEAPPVPVPMARQPEFDPGKVDGRTLRRTGREPFATRIKPETHEALKRFAFAEGITIAEALERAVELLAKR